MHSSITRTSAVGRLRATDSTLWLSTRRTLRRLQATIVAGPEQPCWRPGAATMAVLPVRMQDRLLAAGRAPLHR